MGPRRNTIQSQAVLGGNIQAIAPMIVPPDGGWGWVITVVGVVSSIIIDGITFCFFLFREPMLRDMSIQPEDFALLTSMFPGFYAVGGIFACSFGNNFGFRAGMLLGTITGGLAFSSGYFIKNNMLLFFIFVGFFGGLAAGFISVSCCLPAGFYFDKKRPIAFGFIYSGAGCGAALMPQISKQFMNQFGWRMTYLYHGCLILLLTFLGLLIRPLKPVMVLIKGSSTTSIGTTALRDADDKTINFSLFRVPTRESTSAEGGHSLLIRGTTFGNVSMAYPTISRIAQDTDIINIKVRETTDKATLLRLQSMAQLRTVQPSSSQSNPALIQIDEGEWLQPERKPWYKCGCLRRKAVPSIDGRPLTTRTDIMYTGSLLRLEEYTNKGTHLEYNLEVTKVPTYLETIQQFTRTSTTWCCQHFMRGIRTLLDYTLLKSPAFICVAICGFSYYLAYYLPILYGKIRLEKWGKGEYQTTLVTCIGLGIMTGRLSSGLIVTRIPKFGARTTVTCAMCISGSIVLLCTQIGNSIYYQFPCMFSYGYLCGFYSPLTSIIIVDFFGLNSLTSVTGMMILFQGTGCFLGPPLGEALLQFTKNDNSPFYLCGIVQIMAGLSLTPMRLLQKWENERNKRPARANLR